MVKPAGHSATPSILQGAERQMHARFLADQQGGVAPIFALALVPMIGLAGAAIDYSRASAARTAMQASLDATTLMIAKDAQLIPVDQVRARATQLFNAGFGRDDVQSLQINATVTNGS